MTNYKEILRMYCGGYSQRAIATSLHCSRDAVKLCIDRAKERDLTLPVPENVSNAELREQLLNSQQGVRNPEYLLPDFKTIVEELKKPHVTKGLVWTEYIAQCTGTGLKPYSVSQFNALLRSYMQKMNISLHQEYRAGEILELVCSGSSMLLSNRFTDDTMKLSSMALTYVSTILQNHDTASASSQ